jgi:hypothetical protein
LRSAVFSTALDMFRLYAATGRRSAAEPLYHAYDAQNKGVPTLRIRQMGWSTDGWPVARY